MTILFIFLLICFFPLFLIYFITFYKGTESFLKNTYGVEGLERGSNKETLILVLEHTATRNKLFYFNKEKTSEQELLSEFLSN